VIKNYIKVIKKSFTFLRLINCIKVAVSYGLSLLLKKTIVWGYPVMVMIEPTNICNLRCPLCPSGIGQLTRGRGCMSFELFKSIIDQIEKHSFGILLWNQGEPFLNPDFLKMVAYANSKRLYLLTSTNANVEFNAQEIINSGLDLMIVSLDGTTQETYSKYRKGGELSLVLKNVQNIIQTKKAKNSCSPLLVWQFLVMKHNEHEVEQIKTLSTELGVDMLAYKTVQIYSKEDIDEFLPKNQKYSRYNLSDINTNLNTPILKNKCYRIWMQPVVNWNGEMAVCCFDKDIQIKVGDVSKTTFKKVWKSKEFMNFRKNILKNRKKYEICRNCGEGTVLQIRN